MSQLPLQPLVHEVGLNFHSQQGYTLIELMVALALGLLISAAAIQLFITSQTTFSLQQGGADVQDSSIFGLELMSRNIRMANYGGGDEVIDDFAPIGGIVFTSNPDAEKSRLGATIAPTVNLQSVRLGGSIVKDTLLTRGQGLPTSNVGNEWTGISNVSDINGKAQSAQLVIQYRAPQNMFDCEGERVFGPRMSNNSNPNDPAVLKETRDASGNLMDPRMIDGDVVVERYFLRKDTVGVSVGETAARALVLACDAGRYGVNHQQQVNEGKVAIEGYGGAGQVLMSRVDHFDVRLGVETAPNQIQYHTIADYLAIQQSLNDGAGVARPRVVSIQLAVLARAQGKSNSAALNPNQSYVMLDQAVKISVPDSTESSQSGYMRKVYATTVALRNGRGE